jgi:hypothetical protein
MQGDAVHRSSAVTTQNIAKPNPSGPAHSSAPQRQGSEP